MPPYSISVFTQPATSLKQLSHQLCAHDVLKCFLSWWLTSFICLFHWYLFYFITVTIQYRNDWRDSRGWWLLFNSRQIWITADLHANHTLRRRWWDKTVWSVPVHTMLLTPIKHTKNHYINTDIIPRLYGQQWEVSESDSWPMDLLHIAHKNVSRTVWKMCQEQSEKSINLQWKLLKN